MTIHSFIRLSRDFADTVDKGNPNSFLAERLISEYFKLEDAECLTLLGIAQHNDYLKQFDRGYGTVRRYSEFVYQADIARDKCDTAEILEKAGISSPQPTKANPLNRCIPVFLALDLAHELRKPQPADPTPPCPV